MTIGIVTDSLSDLPADLLERYKIEVIPAYIVIGGQSYKDGLEISRTEFYNRLPSLRTPPTTAVPAMDEFLTRFTKMLDSGCTHVLGIFVTEKLTGIADVARKAAQELMGKVSVLETGSLSMGSGFQVLAAARALSAGTTLPECIAIINSVRKRVKVYAALDTMEYMRRSGRIPRLASSLGGILRIKPVIELHEGAIAPIAAPRTTHHAEQELAELVKNLGPLEQLCILHTNAEARAQNFLDHYLNLIPQIPEDIRIINVTTIIGTHVGPNGLGIAAVCK